MHSFLHFKDLIKSYFSGGVVCTLLLLISFVNNTFADGNDDFSTLSANSQYTSATTTDGWKINNAAVVKIDNTVAPTINGKTSAKGTITSPTLKGGCGTLYLKYANTFKENNGVDFSLTIKQDGKDDVTYRITNKDVTQNSIYSWEENINISGDFTIYIINNSPSNNTGNKDRVSIWNITWTGYTENPTKCTKPTFSPEDGTTFEESLTINASTTTTGAKIVYTTNNEDPTTSSATFPAEGLTITGTTTIRAMAVKDGLENSDIATATYTKTKKTVTLNFEPNEYTVNINATTTVKATTNKPNADIKYTTNVDENTCIVDERTGDVIAGNTPATVTITATIDEDGEYQGATATCTLNIVDPNAPIEKFKKVTSTGELSNNDIIIIACPSEKVAASTINNKNKAIPVTVNVSEDEEYITFNETEPIIYTLKSSGTQYQLYSENYGYIGQGSSNTDLSFSSTETSSNKYLWTIDTQNSTVVLKNVGANTRGFFYQKGTANVFGCYDLSNNFGTASYPKTYIYKKVDPNLTINFTKSVYTTYVAPCDIEFPADLSGYIVTNVTENSVITEEILTAPKGTPVIIKANALGTYNLTKANEVVDDVTSNKLQASDGTVTGGNNIYAMAVKSKGAGFYKVSESVTIPAGKAYLVWESAPVNNAKEFIPINGETTGITSVTGEEGNGRKVYYNLNGMRVDNPQKGIYIVNGKKVIF